MSYTGISIRDAIEKINATNSGWYLPQVQRQYVWGARHESETYICLLLDSLLRKYPIGGVVLWETDEKVPYRRFVEDYVPGQFAKLVDEGLWGASKALVYDGQQRLQTLYSVLRHRFNGRILHFDLTFDEMKAEADETGFFFRDPGEARDLRYLRMTDLASVSGTDRQKIALEVERLPLANGASEQELLIRSNIASLWSIFVERDHKSIAYFAVRSESPARVNEVFRRLNTGGIALTQLELVLGKIKAVYFDYEEQLWSLAERLEKKSGGIEFSSTSILQFFHLLIKETIRIDEDRLSPADIEQFQHVLENDSEPLEEFFEGILKQLFNINHASIVPRWSATLPIMAYLVARKRKGFAWRVRTLSQSELQPIHHYFLLSQFCDWNTQTMVNAFAREAMAAGQAGRLFPLEEIRKIAVEKNRTGILHESQLISQPWFAAKVLMPERTYVFHENKPQVDHIFPTNLTGGDEAYKAAVNVLWNFQPVSAEVNNYKRARHPGEFFKSSDGGKYWASYNFIPEPNDVAWDDYKAFIAGRRVKMLGKLEQLYGLTIAPAQT